MVIDINIIEQDNISLDIAEEQAINIGVEENNINLEVVENNIEIDIIEEQPIEIKIESGEKWNKGDPWEDWNGIVNITLISTVWKTKTYQVLFTDNTTFNFDVEDWEDWKEIELQKWTTHIQRRYVWDIDWIDLITIEDLKWEKGDKGDDWVVDYDLVLKLDQTTPQTITGWSPVFARSWRQLVLQRTDEPTLYDTQPTYTVLEYTYWTTKLYRRVYNDYTTATDSFYADNWLTTLIATRALSL